MLGLMDLSGIIYYRTYRSHLTATVDVEVDMTV